MKMLRQIRCIVLCTLLLIATSAARADDDAPPTVLERIVQGVEYRLHAVTFGTTLAPADSDRNPGNRIMNLPRYTGALQLRPDFKLELAPLTFSLQPRAELSWEKWHEGPKEGDERWEHETYIHQWLARWAATESFHLSYGRENLQWGPAYLTSLSNPFFSDNGRANPKTELPAMDFARAVWVPNMTWSLSLIANTHYGHSEALRDNFSKSTAIKADYTGTDDYGSLIFAAGPKERRHIGGFYGRTISEAFLLYAEGAVVRNPGGWYAEPDDNPLGIAMREGDEQTPDRWRASALAGGSYTLEIGPTISMEYLYYGPGYDGAEAERFFDLQERAAGVIDPPGSLTPLGYAALGRSADPELRFLRRNYLMLQALQSDIFNFIDVTLRWTQNLDDGSGRFTGIGDVSLGDHWQVFIIGTANHGSERTEFGSVFDYQAMIGLEYTY
jgi:hypothetical protein